MRLKPRASTAAAALVLAALAGCAGPNALSDRQVHRVHPFRVGVYLARQAPTRQVMMQLGAAGVDFVWINEKNYRRMAELENLHALAARFHVQVYVQLFARLDADEPDEDARARIRDLVRFVQRRRHSEVVVGYGVADEPELNYPIADHPAVAARAERFVALVRSIDPHRRTITTHYGPAWHDFDTDEVWPNVFGATRSQAAALTDAWTLTRVHGLRTFTALAWGRPPESEQGAEPPPPPTDPREHYIYDYAMAAYLAGAEGVVFYIFDGEPHDREWSLVDADACDIDGKWQAMCTAIADIRDLSRSR